MSGDWAAIKISIFRVCSVVGCFSVSRQKVFINKRQVKIARLYGASQKSIDSHVTAGTQVVLVRVDAKPRKRNCS